jgi:hypothetical protein
MAMSHKNKATCLAIALKKQSLSLHGLLYHWSLIFLKIKTMTRMCPKYRDALLALSFSMFNGL